MKNILMLFLTSGLLMAGSACSDYEDDESNDPTFWLWEIEYENNSGISPIVITRYQTNLRNEMEISEFVFSTKDTIFEESIHNYIYLYDSVKVSYNNQLDIIYYTGNQSLDTPNICNMNCYSFTKLAPDHVRYKFTFDPIPELDSKQ